MQVRCPHCRNLIALVDDSSLEKIHCDSCGSHFGVLDDDEQTEDFRSEVRRVGHFELIEKLGQGAFGSVWKARDLELDREVAIKLPRKEELDSVEGQQFMREARAAAQLSHPGVVSVHEVGRDGNQLFIVSDYILGATLREWREAREPGFRQSAGLMVAVAEALQHAHERGVIHRDLKPANILMDRNDRPHLVDFGLAKREAGEITMTVDGRILGTPAYMSPEQARGEAHHVDRRSDIYSLGVILFELLTGELPFRGSGRMMVVQILEDDPPSPRKLNHAVPRDLETITLKCLRKSPEGRYPDADALADDLKRWLDERPILARPVGRLERMVRWGRRNPWIASLTTLTVLVFLVGFLGVSWQWLRAQANLTEANRQATIARRERLKADTQRTYALQQQHRAESQTRRVVAQRLADQARDLTTSDAQLAILLAAEAVEMSLKADESPEPTAVQTLANLTEDAEQTTLLPNWTDSKPGERNPIRSIGSPLQSLQIGAQGRWVGMNVAQTLRLWDLRRDRTIRGQPALIEGSGGAFKRLAVGPHGKVLVAAMSSGMVRLYDLTSFKSPAVDSPDTADLPYHELEGHGRPVQEFEFSPDGNWLITKEQPEGFGIRDLRQVTALLWNIPQLLEHSPGTEIKPFALDQQQGGPGKLAFSPDSKRLATLGTVSDPSVVLWTLDNPAQLDKPIRHDLRSYTRPSEIQFSPSSEQLYFLVLSADDQLYRADISPEFSKPKSLLSYDSKEYQTPIGQYPIAPNSKWFGIWNEKEVTRLWDLTIEHPTPISLPDYPIPVRKGVFSEDGRWLVTVDIRDELRLWNLESAPRLQSVIRPGDDSRTRILTIGIFNRQLRYVLDSGTLGTVDLPEEDSDEPIESDERFIALLPSAPNRPLKPVAARFLGEGQYVALTIGIGSRRTYAVCDLSGGGVQCKLPRRSLGQTDVEFIPGGKFVASLSDDSLQLHSFTSDDASFMSLLAAEQADWVTAFALSPDGTRVVIGKADGSCVFARSTAKPGSPIQSTVVREHRDSVALIAFSPTASHSLTFDQTGEVRIWNLEPSPQLARKFSLELSGGFSSKTQMQWTNDGKWLLVWTGFGREAFLISLASLEAPRVFPIQIRSDLLNSIQLLPRRNAVIVVSYGGYHYYDLQQLESKKSLKPRILPAAPDSVRFSLGPDERWFAVEGKGFRIGLFDLTQPDLDRSERSWEAHTGDIRELTMGPRGRILASRQRGADTVRLWDLSSLDESPDPPPLAAELTGYASEVRHQVFDPAGRFLMTAARNDPTIRLWRLSRGESFGKGISIPDCATGDWPGTFSSQGRWFVVPGSDKSARLYEIADDATVRRARTVKHAAEVETAQFGPDERWLVTVDETGHTVCTALPDKDPSPTTLVARARRTAGRTLTSSERDTYLVEVE